MHDALRQKVPLFALVAWCVALLGVRMWYSGGRGNAFLLWNLILAVIPVLAGCGLQVLARRSGLVVPKILIFLFWLAFLPNAPYLVTDFVHLSQTPPVPQWFEVVLFASFAATGALLCYAAVTDVQEVVAARFGRALGWTVAVGSLLLSGFGIYLGRFLRWNSWDVVTPPSTLAHEVAYQLTHLRLHDSTWQVSIVYGVGLILGFIALRSISPAVLPPRRPAGVSSGQRQVGSESGRPPLKRHTNAAEASRVGRSNRKAVDDRSS
jgi:uncharacterized membrane protein